MCVCAGVSISNVMCDYKSSDERGIRYVQRPLFSIIWHYPPIFFSTHNSYRESRISLLLNSLSSVANVADSDLKIRNLTYYPLFPFPSSLSWIAKMRTYDSKWDRFGGESWAQHLAAVQRMPSSKKKKKKKKRSRRQSTKEHFNMSFVFLIISFEWTCDQTTVH